MTNPWHQGHPDDVAAARQWQDAADPAARQFVTEVWDALASTSPGGIARAWMNAEGIFKATVRGAVPPPPLSHPGPPTPAPRVSDVLPSQQLLDFALEWLEERGFLDRFAQSLFDVLTRLWATAWLDGGRRAHRFAEEMSDEEWEEATRQPRRKHKAKPRRKAKPVAKPVLPPVPGPAVPVATLSSAQLVSVLLAADAAFAAWMASAMITGELSLIVGSLATRVARLLATASAQGWSVERLTQALEQAFLTRWRAQMIAATEASRASTAGMVAYYRSAGIRWVRWVTRHDARVCPVCKKNEASGTHRLGTKFPSGDVAPPAHPNCRCYLVPSSLFRKLIGKTAGATADKVIRRSDVTLTQRVYDQLLEDYPPSSIQWVKKADWTGPLHLPISQINYTPDKWQAGHERKKVARFKKKIRQRARKGKTIKPAVLIDRPDTDRGSHLIVIDGHHRTMAFHELGMPVLAFVGKVDMATARVAEESHDYQYTTAHGGSSSFAATARKAIKAAAKNPPVAAGIAVRAGDTGRVLMLQRHLVDRVKPAAGKWEFPGGRREGDEGALDAALREWAEETGCMPPEGVFGSSWTSPDGKYRGFVLHIPSEADIPTFTGRGQVVNPDDPDGDHTEALAWWHPRELRRNPAMRDEIRGTHQRIRRAIRTLPAAQKSARTPVVSTQHHKLGPEGLWHTPSKKVPKKQQLPAYVQNTARALMRDHGLKRSRAIATAINAIKEWAQGHAFGGKVKVTPQVQHAASRAMAEWAHLKQTHH